MASITIPSDQWAKILQLLRDCPDVYVGDAAECQRFVEGVLWMDRSGAPWRLLPGRVWQLEHHLQTVRPVVRPWRLGANAPAFQYGTGPGISGHRQYGGPRRTSALGEPPQKGGQSAQALGRSRGGFSTKVPGSVDALGNPLRFTLTPGQQHDITQAETLLTGYRSEYVIADKGYDAQDFVDHLAEAGMVAVIPPRSNRKAPRDYDRPLYRERHVVECFIGKIKHYRRVFSRFDKLASRYLGFLQFAAALIWLR